ncbi:type I-F CRISPR-associated protein Csy2 [Dialister hominis]|uniref:type I-F CRISPR-associated protein Csy2 n=1 Tax=Dialister hominis TaxID=2582419 RepID=UPI004026DC59
MSTYLVIRKMQIHNANAMSSTYTIGVPAMTAWLGAVHALERKVRGLNQKKREDTDFSEIHFTGVAVSFHKTRLHVFKGAYGNAIVNTANPLKIDGTRPSAIEEPRIDLVVSILIEMKGFKADEKETLLEKVRNKIWRMKIAGGDINGIQSISIEAANEDNLAEVRHLRSRLMPGYVIIERRDILKQEMGNGANGLDALLDYTKVNMSARKDESGKVTGWDYSRKGTGWIVPIAVGFKGLSPLGICRNQRDKETQHRFAESVVTLGEFRMPYHFDSIDDMMWRYAYDESQELYLCRNQKI